MPIKGYVCYGRYAETGLIKYKLAIKIIVSKCFHMHVVVFYMYTQLKKILPHLTYTYRSLLLEQSLSLFMKFGLGERQMTANVHSLLHLPEVVRSLGPLWAHSCFPYEDAKSDIIINKHNYVLTVIALLGKHQ